VGRILALGYGALCYVFFLYVFLSAIWFVWTMDDTQATMVPWLRHMLIDAGLLSLFAIQHSVMARHGFKRMWLKLIPRPIERSTYVLAASICLWLIVRFWQPLPETVWEIESPFWITALHVVFWMGWAILLIATFLIDHFELFGLKQVWIYFKGHEFQPPVFATPGFYKFVRHPIYMGFLLGFCATPHMTMGHLLFSIMTTGYILVAIQLEERDLISVFGEQYRVYRSGVSMLVPVPKGRRSG
jgi:protein-S-isoprenylcysteine O-methyltransferase Ste14